MSLTHAPATNDQYVALSALMTGADQSRHPFLIARTRTLLLGRVLTDADFPTLMPALVRIQAQRSST